MATTKKAAPKKTTKKKATTPKVAKTPKPVTVKVEDLQEGDILIIDGKRRKFGYRYQSGTKDIFNLWLLDGRSRWLPVKHGSKVKIVKREES